MSMDTMNSQDIPICDGSPHVIFYNLNDIPSQGPTGETGIVKDGNKSIKLVIRGLCLAIDNTVAKFKSRNITPTAQDGTKKLPTYSIHSIVTDVHTYCRCLSSIQVTEDKLKESYIYDSVYSNDIERIKNELQSTMCLTSGTCGTMDTDKQSISVHRYHHLSVYQSYVFFVFGSLKQYLKDLLASF